jgi:heme/copper-type cytochrome/quinol oxidase subunit 2
MTTPYLAQQPIDDTGFRLASKLYSVTLAANTEETLTVPGTAPKWKAVITVKNDTWFTVNATAAVPAGGTFAATTSELIMPGQKLCREVNAADVIHVITATASTDVGIVFYAVGSNS